MIIITEYGNSMSLSPPRNESFTHSHTEIHGGGYYCVHDLIVDRDQMTVRMSAGNESCEFNITRIIDQGE